MSERRFCLIARRPWRSPPCRPRRAARRSEAFVVGAQKEKGQEGGRDERREGRKEGGRKGGKEGGIKHGNGTAAAGAAAAAAFEMCTTYHGTNTETPLQLQPVVSSSTSTRNNVNTQDNTRGDKITHGVIR